MPWEVPQRHGAKDHNLMRHFDPESDVFRFQGKPVHLPTMGHAVEALKRSVDFEVAQLRALLYPTPEHVVSPEFPSVMPS